MKLGRVVGLVVATAKEPGLGSQRLLMVQPTDADGGDRGRPRVVLDAIGAGVGEAVFWVTGKEASFPFSPAEVPTDATITGIIDPTSNPGSSEPAPGGPR